MFRFVVSKLLYISNYHDLHYSLGNLRNISTASLFASNSGAYTTKSGLVNIIKKMPRTFLNIF